MMRVVLACAGLVAVLACRGGTGPAAAMDCTERVSGPMRILFIGNSLTYTNALPYMVRSLVDSAGEAPPDVVDVTLPDFGLEQHWEDGRAAQALRSRCWDVVVLQQGPSSLPESRALLLDYAARFAAIAREQGARPALFSVWPAQPRRADFTRAIESYALAAESTGGVMLPAATAWLQAWERDPGLELYEDGLHPTLEGSYLAALVIAGRLYGRAAAEMPSAFSVRAAPWSSEQVIRIDPAVAAVLRQAAQAALDVHPQRR